MSFRPFTSTEIESLKREFEKNGWRIDGAYSDFLRYSINRDNLIVLTIKIPITLNVQLSIPFQLSNFRASIAFKLWDLNARSIESLTLFMKYLRFLVEKTRLQHDLPINEKSTTMNNLILDLIPEPFKNENESRWINRIRISIMSHQDQFKQYDIDILNKVIKALQKTNLSPTFKLPNELRNGVPKNRVSEVLFFSNNEIMEEFFIIEKGFLTYFKDLMIEKIFLRSMFDSYAPYVLAAVFNDININFDILIENWIKFSRMALNSLIEIINNSKLSQNEYIRFHPEIELEKDNFEEDKNNFPFTPLHYESKITKAGLYKVRNDLLNSPPVNFEILKTLNEYIEAEELIRNYKFAEATELLTNSLKIFNKNRQRKVVVEILLKLCKIASLMKNDAASLNYLQSALGVAKSGEIPADYIIKIHYKLGKYFLRTNNKDKAMEHFKIIVNFLENVENAPKNDSMLGMAYLYLGLILSDKEQVTTSRDFFKKALEKGKNSTKVKLKYYLLRARQFKDKGNFSQAQKFLRAGIDSVGIDFDQEDFIFEFMDLVLELIEFYIHIRLEPRKAFFLLKNIEERVFSTIKDIKGIKRAIQWNMLMTDFYDKVERSKEKSSHYYKQAMLLINQLKKIGISY